jgi:hypothetical protein
MGCEDARWIELIHCPTLAGLCTVKPQYSAPLC